MTLGIAIFILGCMWFYFKEPGFKKFVHVTLKVLGVLVLLSGLGLGGWYLKTKHDENIQAAQAKAEQERLDKQAAEEAANRAKICADWEMKHPIGSPLDKEYNVKLGDGTVVPSITWDVPTGCEGSLEAAYNNKQQNEIKAVHGPWEKYTKTAKSTVWSVCDSDLTSEPIEQGINTGHLPKGESAQLLTSNTFGAKVKTHRGEIGWVYPGSCISTKQPVD